MDNRLNNGNRGEHVESLLPAYVNGTLDLEGADVVRAHLAGCAACQAALDEWLAIGTAAQAAYVRALEWWRMFARSSRPAMARSVVVDVLGRSET